MPNLTVKITVDVSEAVQKSIASRLGMKGCSVDMAREVVAGLVTDALERYVEGGKPEESKK